MKQYISHNQIEGLSKLGKVNLLKWWVNRKVEETMEPYYFYNDNGGFLYPRLSIGQLIEFIVDDQRKCNFKWPSGVSFPCSDSDGTVETINLCDTLWDEVKEILEEH